MGSLAAASPQYLQNTVVKLTAFLSNLLLNLLVYSMQGIHPVLNNFCSLVFQENYRLTTIVNIVARQTLSRSYGRLFAEFLNEESLVRLGLLDLSTCVGLRYG